MYILSAYELFSQFLQATRKTYKSEIYLCFKNTLSYLHSCFLIYSNKYNEFRH